MDREEGPRTVAVLIVTYNSAACLPDLLDSIPAALDGLAADVVVVDNDSDDATRDVASGRAGVRVIHSSNGGYAHGINVGVRATPEAHAWLILNPDLRLSPRCARTLLGHLHGDVGIVGPRVVDDDGQLVPSMRREPTLLRALGLPGRPELAEYVKDPAQYDLAQDADWLLGASLMISRDCWTDVGPWDESFFLYSEETDFCLRARSAGWRSRYVPDAVVQHSGGGSGRSGRTHAMQILNRVRLYARRHGVLAAAAYYAVAVLSEASWVVRGNAVSRESLRSLLRPAVRPTELHLSRGLIPR